MWKLVSIECGCAAASLMPANGCVKEYSAQKAVATCFASSTRFSRPRRAANPAHEGP